MKPLPSGQILQIRNDVRLLTLLRNPYLQVKFFFNARCAPDTKSIGIEATEPAPVACVLFRPHFGSY